MIKAFLSHTSVDKDLVSLVHEKLSGSNAWYDAANIENGESIPEKINEGLRIATHYVLFWSENAKNSPWVKAELNAAFVRFLASKCKFMIFCIDDTELPELLQPYKYNKVSKEDLDSSAEFIANTILSQDGSDIKLSEFVNRNKEIGEIEEAVRGGYRLVILSGILGIGKSSIAEKALEWLYPNRAAKRILLDFSRIPGIAELCVELSRKLKRKLSNDGANEEDLKLNIRYLLEVLSDSNSLLILKDVKNWLNEDGTLNNDLQFVTDIIVSTEMFDGLTIMTSSRYVEIPDQYYETTWQMRIEGMDDAHIASIIGNNLPRSFQSNPKKNMDFAKRLYGYPLGAKLASYRINVHGYDYYLGQPQKIQKLKIGLAKQLISFAGLSDECQEYLKIVALCQSRLRNEEYALAFPSMKENIAAIADEAFFAGILKFDDDGCYKLEPLVEDFYYDLAFNSKDRKDKCSVLKDFLDNQLKDAGMDQHLRLLPAAVHIFTLSGDISGAIRLHSAFTSTVTASMWDQYNHSNYDESMTTAEGLLTIDSKNSEARYVKALCLTRFDEYDSAEEILSQLLNDDPENIARYYYALGRIQERKGNFEGAIELFEIAILKKKRYLSPYREMAQCYIHLGRLEDAKSSIDEAKKIDDSNVFIILLEAFLLQKQGKAEQSLELLSDQSILYQNAAQVYFRKGRAYDQLGKKDEAKRCYNEALSYQPNMYDAKLCLLSQEVVDCTETTKDEIKKLKEKLHGKRRAILINIEARLIGYVEQNIAEALSLLDTVPVTLRDRQWYAVKIQLLQKKMHEQECVQRMLLAKEIEKEVIALQHEYEQKFGAYSTNEFILSPDT